jgi:hypothetical protein
MAGQAKEDAHTMTTFRFRKSPRCVLAVSAIALVFRALPALAQLPDARLFSVFPPGGQQGTKLDVTLAGVDLDGVDRLLFSRAGITAVAKILEPDEFAPTARPAPNQFTVTIAPDVPAGRYEMRAVGKYGVSNPRSFVVGREEALTEVEPNNTLERANEVKLGATINGRCDAGTDLDHFKFAARAGQRLLIDCEARRIDSRLEAVLVVLDSKGRELARAAAAGCQDPLLDFSVPADGEYTLVVHDFIYGGSNEYFYRLTLGAGPHVDFVFPPAGVAGSKTAFRVYGRNLPGGQPAQGLTVDGRPLEVLSAEIQMPSGPEAQAIAAELPIESPEASVDGIAFRLPTPSGPANPVLVSLASAPVVAETEPNDKPDKAQRITTPCECAGQFYPANDFDWYTFEAKQGEVLWIELFSQRLGVASDPFLLVQQVKPPEAKPDDAVKTAQQPKEQVVDLQAADDVPSNIGGFQFTTTHDDPSFRFVAPADGAYRVLVRDLSASIYPDPRRVYRLAIRGEQPDFRLVAVPRFPGVIADPNQNQPVVWNPLLRKGGSELVDVLAFRRDGFDGEIVVSAEGLPAGVTSTTATIGPGQSSATLVLTAADSAGASVTAFSVVGKAKLAGVDAVRAARGGSMVWPGQIGQVMARARLCQNLVLAVSDEPAPFLLQAGGEVLEMSRAGKIEVPVTIARKGEFKGNVALAPYGLPPAIQPQNITLDGNTASGKLTLNLQANAPVGTYSFYLLGTTQVTYRRNPEAADAAAKHKAEVEKLFNDATAQAKAMLDAKTAADKLAADTTAEAKRTADAGQAAGKAAAEADANSKAAAEKLTVAKAARDKDQNNQALAEALTAAEKALAEAATQLKTAIDAKTVADKTAQDAATKSKAAAEAKVVADKAAADADAKAKRGAAAKAEADKQAADAEVAARPNNINVGYPSSTVTIKITAAPITMSVKPPAALKQGMKLELPVAFNRLYAYAGPVQLNFALPQGVGGLNIPQVNIPADKNDGVVVIEAGPNATPGKHVLTVQATVQFNGQNLQIAETVPLVIEKVEPPEKK